MDNIRVSELAKELGLTSREVIDKFAQLSITIKSHSNVVTSLQVSKLKDFIAGGSKLPSKKPKAFIVKKAKKTPEEEALAAKEPISHVEAPANKEVHIVERVQRIEMPEKAPIKPAEEENKIEMKKEVSTEKPEKSVDADLARKVEVIKPIQPKNRLEIVKRAPIKRVTIDQNRRPNQATDRPYPRRDDQRPDYRPGQNQGQRPYQRRDDQRPGQNQGQRPDQRFGQRPGQNQGQRPDQRFGQRPGQNQGQRPDQRPGQAPDRNKKPLERRIIPQDIYENKGFPKKRVDVKKKAKDFNSKKEEQERISLEKTAAQHHKKKSQKEETIEVITSLVVNKPMTISELAVKIQKTPAEIVRFLMFQGVMATVNQLIDVDVIKKVCGEYELEVLDEDMEAFMEEELEREEQKKIITDVDKKLLKRRAPVVSIMGHVDHGKTTLLDSIRASKHKIVSTEVGGITQSIGAYTVFLDDTHDNSHDKKIVFVDTPGHEAFTEMRARGAKATDIAILVVAADDGIMPQTVEAINHAKAAEVPVIVAVNKIDKPGADPDRVLQQLTEHGLVPEAWGGDTITVNVSALLGTGIDELLEYIWILADIKDLKANPKAEASGVVIEANLDKGKGPVATLLVQNGTLRTGNCVVVGSACGRIRALLSDSGERILKAEPSTPVEILGLSEVPMAGDFFMVVKNDKEMKRIVSERQEKERDKRLDAMLPAHIRKESMSDGNNNIPQLNLIIKANTNGSAEAVSQAIAQLESKEIITKIIHVGVGDISEADVMLASASGALILGFTVKEDSNALVTAEKEGVVIKKYDIIYQILEDIEKTMISLLSPEVKVVATGTAEIRQVFTIGKITRIAGCYVTEGKIQRSNLATVKRDGKEIFKGQLDQLKRFKDDVKEVAQGFECGISFTKFNDIEVGDIVEFTKTEEVERSELG